MNRLSLLFVALLAASFAVPGHAPETSQGTSNDSLKLAHSSNKDKAKPGAANVDPGEQAEAILTAFLSKGSAFASANQSDGYHVLFATVADPVQTHLAAAFDHDVAAMQDGIQDSGYLFDSSWIPWDLPRAYDSLDDEVNAETLRNQKHDYPGMLFFRKDNAENPYAQGLIVFLLAEKPTAGINTSQAMNAVRLFATAAFPTASVPFPNPILILGPTYSGSLHSLVPLVSAFKASGHLPPNPRFLIRSSGFTSCSPASNIARTIAQQFSADVDLGSANHPFDTWTQFALNTLEHSGITPDKVAVLSEGESLFGESVEMSAERVECEAEYKTAGKPLTVEFPRDISALRSLYEKQGLLDNSSPSETSKRFLHLGTEEAKNGDSIRTFGDEDTLAAQESVLFGISEFLRSHTVHGVVIVATSEEDSYFLTRFIHANNAGVRVVIVGATRLFMRGSTAQFRGDMMVSSYPLLPRLSDWTNLQNTVDTAPSKQDGTPQDETAHVFPNDSSEGEYIAVRDLLWEWGSKKLPHEYSPPLWLGRVAPLRPPMYISALGGGAAWPIAEWDYPDGFRKSGEFPPTEDPTRKQTIKPNSGAHAKGAPPRTTPLQPKNSTAAGKSWRLQMPFLFAAHFEASSPSNSPHGTPKIEAASFWKLLFWICAGVPSFYCIGIVYADPVRRRKFAYLQPATAWEHWILLVTVPALLSEAAYLVIARPLALPSAIVGNHTEWWWATVVASLAFPSIIFVICWMKAKQGGSLSASAPNCQAVKTRFVFASTIVAIVVIFIAVLVLNLSEERQIPQILAAYREMHWESGLSLMPTILLIILAISVWNYQVLVSISVLDPRPLLPDFLPEHERISDKAAGQQIANAAQPFPRGKASSWFWIFVAFAVLGTMAALSLWPSFRAISSLSAHWVTVLVFVLASFVSSLMFMDILQFTWLWSELHDLLLALGTQKFKRSFVPLRDFNWKNVWSFSGGSFQEKQKVLAAQVECVCEMAAMNPTLITDADSTALELVRLQYSKLDAGGADLATYRRDLSGTYQRFATIGSNIAQNYAAMVTKAATPSCAQTASTNDAPFRDEERELEQLPAWLCIYERFLCLLYVAFIRTIIARLRTLALSIVSVFSVIALAMAIYPFQPMQPLFIVGVAIFLLIGTVMFVVFSQMDKDPILARILQSDPNKLEWSFYGKFIDTLALPLLTLLSSLLPGGAGRLIDFLRTAFSHAQ